MNLRAKKKFSIDAITIRRWLHWYDLMYELVARDLKVLYKRSILGIAWTMIRPLMELAVFAFVFGSVLSVSTPHFRSFIFTGIVVWTWFFGSLVHATGVIVANRTLIRQPGFPVAILPVAAVATHLIHFLLAFPILIIFLLLDGARIPIGTTILALPILVTIQFIFTVNVSYWLASINVFLRDTQHTVGILLNMLFYCSGVFFSIDIIPQQYRGILYLNPMVHLINAYRVMLNPAFLAPSESFWTSPLWIPLLLLGLISLITLPLGYRFFRSQSYRFAENI